MDRESTMARNRYIRARCPLCNDVSPVCDQREDVRRDVLHDWWFVHRFEHITGPIIERAEGDSNDRDPSRSPGLQGVGRISNFTGQERVSDE